MLGLLENLEVDAGLTYLDNEPLGKVRSVPLYDESYRLITAPDSLFGDRDQVTWKEVGQVPLCLLTPDMQNRRIIDRALLAAGTEANPTLTSNSVIVLYTHVKTGRWASVMPAKLADTLGLSDAVQIDPDRRSAGDLPGRTGGSVAGSDDADGRGIGSDRAQRLLRHLPGDRKSRSVDFEIQSMRISLSLHGTALLIFGSILALIALDPSSSGEGAMSRGLRSIGAVLEPEFSPWHVVCHGLELIQQRTNGTETFNEP